jgi:hypothetical protein
LTKELDVNAEPRLFVGHVSTSAVVLARCAERVLRQARAQPVRTTRHRFAGGINLEVEGSPGGATWRTAHALCLEPHVARGSIVAAGPGAIRVLSASHGLRRADRCRAPSDRPASRLCRSRQAAPVRPDGPFLCGLLGTAGPISVRRLRTVVRAIKPEIAPREFSITSV